MRQGSRGGLILLVGSLVALGGVEAQESVGAQRCGACHQEIYRAWSASAHARSLERLKGGERANPMCLSCHSLGLDRPRRGVQCESCHGEGQHYRRREIMEDRGRAQAAGLRLPGAEACGRCHTKTSPHLLPFPQVKAVSPHQAHGATWGGEP